MTAFSEPPANTQGLSVPLLERFSTQADRFSSPA